MDLLNDGIPKEIVAKGYIVSKDPSKEVGGKQLGQDFWEVYVERAFHPEEPLPRPFQDLRVVGDAVNELIAWPLINVCYFSFSFSNCIYLIGMMRVHVTYHFFFLLLLF